MIARLVLSLKISKLIVDEGLSLISGSAKKMRFFSIIIPAYNCENKIEKMLLSIFSQEFSDYQVIIVDDGSTDKTFDCCMKIKERSNDDIKIIHQDNQGPSAARKTGFAHSNAKYTLFFDADDYIHKDTLKILHDNLINEDIDVLEFGFQKIDCNGELLYSMEIKNEQCITDCLTHYIKQDNTTNYLCNKAFRRELINLSDFNGLYYSEDACMLTSVFSRAKKYKSISDKLYFYVISEESACGQKFNEKRLDTIRADKIITELVSKEKRNLLPYVAFNNCLHASKLALGFYRSKTMTSEINCMIRKFFNENYKLMNGKKIEIFRCKSKNKIFGILAYHYLPFVFKLI